MTVKLRYSDFRTVTRGRSAAAPVGSLDALAGIAVALVRGLFPLEKPVRLLGVTVSGFVDDARGAASRGQSAFDFPDFVLSSGSNDSP